MDKIARDRRKSKAVESSSAHNHFLILYAGIVTLLVISFLVIRKKPRPPTTLQLIDDPSKSDSKATLVRQPGVSARRVQQADPNEDTAPGVRAPREKSLNVMFNWNGHSWDAFEVLGIPAGSSASTARSAWQQLEPKADAESRPFLQAALTAIERSQT